MSITYIENSRSLVLVYYNERKVGYFVLQFRGGEFMWLDNNWMRMSANSMALFQEKIKDKRYLLNLTTKLTS